MIDAENFLDKLLYMGYMDEQKSEIEEVANRMTEEAYTKEEVMAMLSEIQLEIEKNSYPENVYGDEYGINEIISTDGIYELIQQKIDKYKVESEGE